MRLIPRFVFFFSSISCSQHVLYVLPIRFLVHCTHWILQREEEGESRRKEKASWLLIASLVRPAWTITWTAVACNLCMLGLPVVLASASLSGVISRFFRVYRSSTSSIGFCFFQIKQGWSTSSSTSNRDDSSRFFVWSSLLVLSTSFPSSSFRFSLLQSSCHFFPFTVFLCVRFCCWSYLLPLLYSMHHYHQYVHYSFSRWFIYILLVYSLSSLSSNFVSFLSTPSSITSFCSKKRHYISCIPCVLHSK